jgi:hypothetical protein
LVVGRQKKKKQRDGETPCSPLLSLSSHLRAVELLLDVRRNGLDLRPQLLLDAVKVEPVVVRNEVDRQTQVAEAPRPPDAVQIGLAVFREVEVDDNVDRLDVDAAREEVGADEVAAEAVAEVVEDAVAVGLRRVERGFFCWAFCWGVSRRGEGGGTGASRALLFSVRVTSP